MTEKRNYPREVKKTSSNILSKLGNRVKQNNFFSTKSKTIRAAIMANGEH